MVHATVLRVLKGRRVRSIGYGMNRRRAQRLHLHEAGGHVALLAGLAIHVPQLRILMRRQQKVAAWHAFIVPDVTPASRCRCGSSERSPGADVAAVSAVPVQMWQRTRLPR